MAKGDGPLLQETSPAEQVHVHEERTAGHDLRLPLATRQQPALRILRHRTDCADRRHSGRPCQDPAHSSYRSGPSLTANGKRTGSVMRQHTDTDRLQLKLAHPADCSDAISTIRQRTRKLRS